MKYLVTGGAGFVGSNIVHRLLAEGHQVRVLDNLDTGRLENLAEVLPKIELMEEDVADPDVACAAVAGVDGVFHQAGAPAVPRSLADPIGTNRANVLGTLHILEACRNSGGVRLIYAASSSAYGNIKVDIKQEDLRPDPCSPYAVQKLVGELYCKVYWEAFQMEALALRYFNVFGPRQNPASHYAAVIPAFIRNMLKGEPPQIFGDGLQSRDFTFVDDVVSANIKAMTAPKEAMGRVYNVARGERTTLLQIVDALNEIMGCDLAPEFLPERPGDVRHSLADTRRANENLHWLPQVSIKEGLRRTVGWIREHE
jgi:nucleoside-diphosphate-sugar epimerase